MFGKRKEIQGRQITISGGNIQNNSIWNVCQISATRIRRQSLRIVEITVLRSDQSVRWIQWQFRSNFNSFLFVFLNHQSFVRWWRYMRGINRTYTTEKAMINGLFESLEFRD
jgi:hypothetical protein